MVDAYPLAWPAGTERTKYPKRSQFNTSFARARDELMKEIRLMGGRNIIISANLTLRNDGLPYANQPQPQDPGIAVYFTLLNEPRTMCCDRWTKTVDNLQAIRLTVAALRGMDRWGVGTVEQYFSGFIALPEAPSWYKTLGLESPDATANEISTAFRRKSRQAHPDHGGTGSDMNIITQARDTGLQVIEDGS